MTMIIRLLAATSLAVAPIAAHAQSTKPWTLQQAIGDPEDFTLSGSVRARYETLDNQFRPGVGKTDDLLSFRTTLFAEYHPGVLRLGAELMDSRGYLDDVKSAVSSNDVNAFELIQGYVGADFGDALGAGSKTTFLLGRQTIDLGSRRLAGRNNFRNATNAFDGFRAEFTGADKTYLTVFYTLPLNRLPSDKQGVLDNKVKWDRESFDVAFWGGFLNKPALFGRANLDLYFFGLNERDSAKYPTKNRKLYTPGLRLYSDPKPGKTDFEFEGAYQFGSTRTGTAPTAPFKRVSAYFLHAEVGHQFAGVWVPRVSLEYDLASGDKGGKDYTRFDGLYGVRRPDYGPSSIDGPLGRNNISSPGIRLEVTPDKRWDGSIMYRAAWLDSATDSFANTGVKDATGRSGKFAGQQIEGRVRYWIVPKLLRLDTGAAWLINGRFLKDAPNANGFGNPIYGYADVTATF
jgi:hypothetical protein